MARAMAAAFPPRFSIADFDRLIKEARVVSDEAKRKELYHAAAVTVRDEGGSIIPQRRALRFSERLSYRDCR